MKTKETEYKVRRIYSNCKTYYYCSKCGKRVTKKLTECNFCGRKIKWE